MKSIRSTSKFVSGFAVFLAVAISSVTPAEGSILGARQSARELFLTLAYLGLNVRDDYEAGLLRKGQSVVIETTLYSGNDYYLVAAGCEDAYDVDIAVFDGNGNLIANDGDSEPVAVAHFSPRWTGTFYVKITMYNSTPDGAHWVLQYAFN